MAVRRTRVTRQRPRRSSIAIRSTEDRAVARLEHDERLRILATLKARQREALYLEGLGYSYQEIAALSGADVSSARWLLRVRVDDMP